MAEAKGAWDGLSENYEAPEQQQLLRALDPALRNAESATGATALVASAMGGFASALQELEPRRQQLIADAEAFNLKGCPVDKAEHAQQMAEGEQLQQSINTLVEEYRQKIKDCTTHLAGINSEGDYSDPNAPDINGAALGQVPNLGTAIAQSREFMKLKISRALRLWTIIGDTKVMQWLANRNWLPSWLGKIKGSIRIPLPPKTMSSTSWSLKGPRPPGNYWQRFATIFRETFLGPPKPTTVLSGPTVTMETTKKVFGAGVEKTGATTSGGTTARRVLERGFFAAGVAMTFNSEYQKADAALKEQQPGLLDGERFLKAGAKASVRTGSQVGAAALAGVAIGSVLPVGGTAVGFTVDSGIGAVTMFPVGEGIFNGIKGLFG